MLRVRRVRHVHRDPRPSPGRPPGLGRGDPLRLRGDVSAAHPGGVSPGARRRRRHPAGHGPRGVDDLDRRGPDAASHQGHPREDLRDHGDRPEPAGAPAPRQGRDRATRPRLQPDPRPARNGCAAATPLRLPGHPRAQVPDRRSARPVGGGDAVPGRGGSAHHDPDRARDHRAVRSDHQRGAHLRPHQDRRTRAARACRPRRAGAAGGGDPRQGRAGARPRQPGRAGHRQPAAPVRAPDQPAGQRAAARRHRGRGHRRPLRRPGRGHRDRRRRRHRTGRS